MPRIEPKEIHDIVFVCSGNICRSPFAEATLRAKMFQTGIEDIRVSSAGTIGGRIAFCTPEAIMAAEEFDVDLSFHRSRQLTEGALAQADLIIVMEESHGQFIKRNWPDNDVDIRLLSEFDRESRRGKDIPDPYGSSIDYYRANYRQIDEAVDGLVAWLKNKGKPAR